MLWLYIHFPMLQLDRMQAQVEQTEVKPLVLVESKTHQVVQLNQPAEQQGIKQGMGLAMAASLLPELVVLPYQAKEEQASLQLLAEQLYITTANIALSPPQGLALQFSDMLKLYQNLDSYLDRVRLVLQPFNVRSQLAVADNFAAAQLLACTNRQVLSLSTVETNAALAAIDIQQLFIEQRAKETLSRLGIKTLKQLQALPMAELNKRLDKATLDYLRQLQGEMNTSLVFFLPQQSFVQSLELLHELCSIERLLAPIKKLLQQLTNFLYRHELLATQLQLKLYQRAEGGKHKIQQAVLISSAEGEYKVAAWSSLIALKLANVQLNGPVTKITLVLLASYDKNAKTNDLFIKQTGQLSLAQLLSLLVNKLGEAQVSALALGQDHRVELSSHYTSFLAQYQAKLSTSTRELSSKNPTKKKQVRTMKLPVRPSFLLAKPEPLIAKIGILYGPERIKTAWWQHSANTENHTTEPNYLRDYYIAKNEQGQLCWVYRQSDRQWFMHGYFS